MTNQRAINLLCQMYLPTFDEEEKEAITKAIEALTEQEPVLVYESKISECICKNTVNRYWHPKFCGFCGRKLMWY